MNYISLFSDIYVAALLKVNTDIVNGYDAMPLVAETTPKNTLSISTKNSQDWSNYVDGYPLISSTPATSGIVPGTGLKQNAGVKQSLIFGLQSPYASVTGFSSTLGTSITNNWGMIIMMSPNITYDNLSPTVLSQTSNTLQNNVSTVNSNGSYNNYTMITLRGSTSTQVLVNCPTAPTKIYFGVYPFTIASFSSIFSDFNNLDIMIATVDGIDGPLNKLVYNGFFLINGFTMVDTPISTLNMGFMNYESTTPMDGSEVPTVLRVKGKIAGTTNFTSLSIFFDKLTPFYANYYTGDIFCESTDAGAPYCQYYQGDTNPQIKNYMSMSRIDINFDAPGTTFNVFIPVTFVAGQNITNFYIGYQETDATGINQLAFIQALTTITINQGTPSSLGIYGPVVTTATIGSTITPMALKANAPGSANILANTGNSIGGGFSYFSQWNYIGASTVTGWTAGTCYNVYYLYYYTNYAAYMATTAPTFLYGYMRMSGIICTTDTSNAGVTTASLSISSGVLPSQWGKSLPGKGAYSQNLGNLVDLAGNYMTVTNDLVISTPVILPPSCPNLVKAVG